MYAYMSTHTYICTHIRMHTHIHIHICIHSSDMQYKRYCDINACDTI